MGLGVVFVLMGLLLVGGPSGAATAKAGQICGATTELGDCGPACQADTQAVMRYLKPLLRTNSSKVRRIAHSAARHRSAACGTRCISSTAARAHGQPSQRRCAAALRITASSTG